MSENEWYARWLAVWFAIGWRELAVHRTYNVGDVLDVCAALLMRVNRLERRDADKPFASWF